MDRSKLLPKTSAKSVYCLADKDLEGLQVVEKPNPRARSGPPMKLYDKESLERVAVRKWGSLAGLEAERAKRQDRRQQRSILAFVQRQGAGSDGGSSEAQAQQYAGSDGGAGPSSSQEKQEGGIGPATGPGSEWRAGLRRTIAERIYVMRPGPSQSAAQQAQQQKLPDESEGGRYIFYWMQTAVRVHENLALDVAVHASQHRGLPLVVAAFLLASHPYATARRFKFLLEGLRDVQRELRHQGGDLLVYLEGHTEPGAQVVSSTAARAAGGGAPVFHPPPGFQSSAGWQRLLELAQGAAVVVTEDMPAPPYADWVKALAEELPPATELCLVDTACVLPMRSVGRSYDRAYAFRAATAGRRQGSLRSTYLLPLPQSQAPGSAVHVDSLVGPAALSPFALSGPAQQDADALAALLRTPWASLDLAALPDEGLHDALCALVAGCGEVLDQSAPPVAHMVGGSTAGYARWEAFRRRGLSLYAARRNNALERDGVSRLSAYHHYGMVSPFKVAREAALDKSAGATKYLDEFLTWREVSYLYCLHHLPRLHSLDALPRWAQQTLARHAADPRSTKPLADLAAGRSGDAWWDAAQQQLTLTGELHNNARMTWGKALLPWLPSPLEALQAALHLNHLFALDGCDPASYGGVLWCFGLFDSPKGSEGTPVYGSLATRPTDRHARRLSPEAYRSLPV